MPCYFSFFATSVALVALAREVASAYIAPPPAVARAHAIDPASRHSAGVSPRHMTAAETRATETVRTAFAHCAVVTPALATQFQ